jgi:hypothetical protein
MFLQSPLRWPTAAFLIWLTLSWCGIRGGGEAAASAILSEIMFRPINGNASSEWVEIVNTGASAIDLSGWQFGKPSAGAWSSAFPAGTTLGSNQALVITPSASIFDSDWGAGKNRIQVSNFPSLPDDPSGTDGRIAIRNGSGAIQDEVTYFHTSGWPNIGAPNTSHSIYVLPQHLSASANNAGGNWGISTTGLYGGVWRDDNHASPGAVATQQQAAFAPSPDAVWSMVVLPDTQNYVERTHAYPLFQGQTNWIKDNKELFNIQAVLHEGDIVNRNSGTASNGVTAVQQWERARDAMHVLNGVVPYIMTAGNHDYGITNSQTRDTKLNTYFKATDNPLVNPATGGILKGTMVPGELQNAYYEFTAPDGRDMLVLALEFWSRNSAVDWAKGVAQQAQYADHTAVLLTHSHVTPGNGFWTTGPNAYEMEGGNDGQDVWNKLLDVTGNFEMTFNGHLGGDETGYRVDANNAGVNVHQMFFNTQFESNAGNGWLRVVEFLEDGETVRIRTYSPHFDLYRTTSAHDFTFKIRHLGTPLVWNTAGEGFFSDGFARGNGNQGVGAESVNPWGAGGKENLLVGFNGNAVISGATHRTAASLRVGTDQASAVIAGRSGNGSVMASGSGNLTLSSSTGSGDLIVGEGGYSGTFNWNSSGVLSAQGKLRIGEGGNGTFNQNNGVVIAGNTAGALKYLAIGSTAGSQGVYNLNNGAFRPSGGFSGTQFRQTRVGDSGASGELNVGDGSGPANSAVLESNDDLFIGRDGGVGLMRVRSDGRVELRTTGNNAEFLVGQGGMGMVVQTGGTVMSDNLVQIGANAGGVGYYTISAGALATATDGSGTFEIGRNGAAGTLRVEGTGSVAHGADLYIGNVSNNSTNGRLEIVGSTASIQIGQLENAAGGASGVRETIFWQADAGGMTTLVITGSGPLASNFVQLQDPIELAANTGAGATLSGDGVALELDLSAYAGSGPLTLIDNRTAESITGFFERDSSFDLFEEGAQIIGTGYFGTVSISYAGGDGNDVVLNLLAGTVASGDFDDDGDVDGADFLTWQRGVGANGGATAAQGDANGDGAVNEADFNIWKTQFGSPANLQAANLVPEPDLSAWIAATAALAAVTHAGRCGRVATRVACLTD